MIGGFVRLTRGCIRGKGSATLRLITTPEGAGGSLPPSPPAPRSGAQRFVVPAFRSSSDSLLLRLAAPAIRSSYDSQLQ